MLALARYLYVRFLAENARFVVANISNHCRTKNDPYTALQSRLI
jgi:hypothetical protein